MKAHAYTLQAIHGKGSKVRLVTYPHHAKPAHLHSTWPAYYYGQGLGFKLLSRAEAVTVLRRWRAQHVQHKESLSRSLVWG